MMVRNKFIQSVLRFHNFLGAFVFKTVLVANRGEVAERIRKTCHKMGIRCLALATEADKDLQFLQRFDDVLLLKDRRGYLDMASIVTLAKANQAKAQLQTQGEFLGIGENLKQFLLSLLARGKSGWH